MFSGTKEYVEHLEGCFLEGDFEPFKDDANEVFLASSENVEEQPSKKKQKRKCLVFNLVHYNVSIDCMVVYLQLPRVQVIRKGIKRVVQGIQNLTEATRPAVKWNTVESARSNPSQVCIIDMF